MSENDLKCCGNCVYRTSVDMGDYFSEGCTEKHLLSSWNYCDEWRFDGMFHVQRKHRIICKEGEICMNNNCSKFKPLDKKSAFDSQINRTGS